MTDAMVTLSELIQPAKTVRAGRLDYPILSMTMHDGLVDQAAKFKKRIASADTSPYKVVRRDQLVVGFPIDEGVLSFQRLHNAAIVSPAYDIWDIRDAQRVEPIYLERFLRSPAALTYYRAKLRGTTARRRSIPDEVFLRLPVHLPPLQEQRRIAAILDKADELRAKRRAAVAQLDTLTQSIFLDMFGDVARNDRHWPSARMGDLMTIRRGGSPRPIDEYLGGEISWIRIGDASTGSDTYIDETAERITKAGLRKTVFLRAGSLILANSGVSLGFARILRIDGCIHDGWLSLEDIPEDKLDKLFLLKALNSITEHFRRIAPKGTQPNLNIDLLSSSRMIVPPISMQLQFASILRLIERQKASSTAASGRSDALFASLQHRAFRGEL